MLPDRRTSPLFLGSRRKEFTGRNPQQSSLSSLNTQHRPSLASTLSFPVCLLLHFSRTLFFCRRQSPSAAGNSAGTEDKKSPSTTASISGDEGPGDSAAASGEGSEAGVWADGKGSKEGSTSSSAEAASSSVTAAPAAGDAPAASASASAAGAAAEDEAPASRWGGKKSFLDVSPVPSRRVELP